MLCCWFFFRPFKWNRIFSHHTPDFASLYTSVLRHSGWKTLIQTTTGFTWAKYFQLEFLYSSKQNQNAPCKCLIRNETYRPIVKILLCKRWRRRNAAWLHSFYECAVTHLQARETMTAAVPLGRLISISAKSRDVLIHLRMSHSCNK